MNLIPIQSTLEENEQFASHPDCMEILEMTVDFFQRVGFQPPWIGYFAEENNELVGGVAFKGPPADGKIEISYGTFERFRNQGIGTRMCRALVELARREDPLVEITARTLKESSYSTRILEVNGFKLRGTVMDVDDGEVWEWVFENTR